MAMRKQKKVGKRRSSSRSRERRKPAAAQVLLYGADAGVLLMTGAIGVLLMLAWFARDLPRTDNLWRSDRAAQISFVARDGSPLPQQGVSAGAPVRLSELPAHVPNAILAVEDRNFRHHIGVNPISVARAFIVNASEGEVRQGGSTITQQLAKNLFLSADRTLKRKIQELMLALWLEHRFTKDEILTLYLNRVYFGGGAYGVDAASHRYFAKPARNLSVNEAAVLAGLLKAPSKYSPSHNPKDAGMRARIAIEAMVAAKFLTPAAADLALANPVVLKNRTHPKAPYFLDFARQEARRVTTGLDADLIVKTTLDLRIQKALETGIFAGAALAKLEADVEVAAVIMDREGAVRAMAGGRDYSVSQFNRVTQARRQSGSAFKPFVYLAAIEQGASPQQKILDAPIKIGKWSPDNYNSRFYGEVTFNEALARSLNSAAIRLQEKTGRNAVRLVARRMGLETELSGEAALALGVDSISPLMLASAYTPFANGGYRIIPHGIDKVTTANGRLAYRLETPYGGVAASNYPVESVNGMLRSVVEWGTGRAAQLERFPAFGKTGTTQNNRDAWFAGHAGGLVCVVWVGRDDNSSLGDVTGGSAPAVIWREVMNRTLAATPPTAADLRVPIIAPLQLNTDRIEALIGGES